MTSRRVGVPEPLLRIAVGICMGTIFFIRLFKDGFDCISGALFKWLRENAVRYLIKEHRDKLHSLYATDSVAMLSLS
jgi:hypothetical protein